MRLRIFSYVGLTICFLLMMCSPSPLSAQEPSLSITDQWLAANLPGFVDGCDDWSCADTTRQFRVDRCEIRVDNKFHSSENTGQSSPTKISTVSLYPRAGVTLTKHISFNSNHPQAHDPVFMESVDVINLRNVDLARVEVITYTFAVYPVERTADITLNSISPKVAIIPTTDPDLAPRLATALRRASKLCGATKGAF
jgi:hypothetical protein